ncbi:MAG: type II toxin-antitoxin system VapC family toxin [Chloroflexota bacterium]
MKAALVLDASAALAMILEEAEGPAVQRHVHRYAQDDAIVLVPDHFWLEVINTMVRRRRAPMAEVLRAIHDLDEFEISTAEIDRPLLWTTLDLAERHGLTSYDAAYLALAIVEDAPLLTLDHDLAVAAGDRAVSLDGGHRLNETPAVYEHEVTWPSYARASNYLAQLRARARAAAESA